LSFLPPTEPERTAARNSLVESLAGLAAPGAPVFLAKIDGAAPGESDLSQPLLSAGFRASSRGYLHRGT
jgi:hypothetical protein